MPPLQRRLEGGLIQTLSVLFKSAVLELAWKRAKLSTCFGGLGIGVAQMGFAAQATYWSTAPRGASGGDNCSDRKGRSASYAGRCRRVRQSDDRE